MAPHGGEEAFDFDRVFGAHTPQEVVFEEVARQPVLDCVERLASTAIIAFGASSGGKTFAITGGVQRFADRGLIPRSISAMFEALSARPDRADYEVSVSFYEIYKDNILDLLSGPRRPPAMATPAVEDMRALRRRVSAESDAYHLLFQGDASRHFEQLPLNRETSRGHVFYVLHLTHLVSGREASVCFADLAAVVAMRDHATSSVARGLDAFRSVVEAIHAGAEPDFKASILTRLLQPWLQPGPERAFVALLSPTRWVEELQEEIRAWLGFARFATEAFQGAGAGAPKRVQEAQPARPDEWPLPPASTSTGHHSVATHTPLESALGSDWTRSPAGSATTTCAGSYRETLDLARGPLGVFARTLKTSMELMQPQLDMAGERTLAAAEQLSPDPRPGQADPRQPSPRTWVQSGPSFGAVVEEAQRIPSYTEELQRVPSYMPPPVMHEEAQRILSYTEEVLQRIPSYMPPPVMHHERRNPISKTEGLEEAEADAPRPGYVAGPRGGREQVHIPALPLAGLAASRAAAEVSTSYVPAGFEDVFELSGSEKPGEASPEWHPTTPPKPPLAPFGSPELPSTSQAFPAQPLPWVPLPMAKSWASLSATPEAPPQKVMMPQPLLTPPAPQPHQAAHERGMSQQPGAPTAWLTGSPAVMEQGRHRSQTPPARSQGHPDWPARSLTPPRSLTQTPPRSLTPPRLLLAAPQGSAPAQSSAAQSMTAPSGAMLQSAAAPLTWSQRMALLAGPAPSGSSASVTAPSGSATPPPPPNHLRPQGALLQSVVVPPGASAPVSVLVPAAASQPVSVAVPPGVDEWASLHWKSAATPPMSVAVPPGAATPPMSVAVPSGVASPPVSVAAPPGAATPPMSVAVPPGVASPLVSVAIAPAKSVQVRPPHSGASTPPFSVAIPQAPLFAAHLQAPMQLVPPSAYESSGPPRSLSPQPRTS